MKKELRRSFLQKNEIDDCMVELLKKYGSYIRAKAISAVSNEAEREELTAGIIFIFMKNFQRWFIPKKENSSIGCIQW